MIMIITRVITRVVVVARGIVIKSHLLIRGRTEQ